MCAVRVPKFDSQGTKWPVEFDLLPRCRKYAVVPIDRVTRCEKPIAIVPDYERGITSGLVHQKPFRVEPAFCLTIHKSQGLTLPRTVRRLDSCRANMLFLRVFLF